ncbi:unnamed protein product [Anisakis simplex]|uniref:Uncharacterized protein n=1 Tax=Anisakis simplex TaxID=6269 RepID=A0A0M3JBN7_ANISI|nr:unnamed protein product [Anisakis simplex]
MEQVQVQSVIVTAEPRSSEVDRMAQLTALRCHEKQITSAEYTSKCPKIQIKLESFRMGNVIKWDGIAGVMQDVIVFNNNDDTIRFK